MATVNDYLAIADACADVSKAAKSLKYLSAQVLANNSAQGLNWGSVPAGVEADGVITGREFTAAEVSNVLGSLTQYANLWDNAVVTQGTHGGNFEKLTKPIV